MKKIVEKQKICKPDSICNWNFFNLIFLIVNSLKTIDICDGSQEEYNTLINLLIENKWISKLDKMTNWYFLKL